MDAAHRQRLHLKLQPYDQHHLLQWWDDLAPEERGRLVEQIERIDFELLQQLIRARRNLLDVAQAESESLAERARRAVPPHAMLTRAWIESHPEQRQHAIERGTQALQQGQVGVLLVAGGQGTRLGFPHPKGMYPIGPVSRKPLFALLAEQVVEQGRRTGREIPYYVMTSDATHQDTVRFFQEQSYFGLPPDSVRFFAQGNMPAVDLQTGRLLMSSRCDLQLSPDGHGGLVEAIWKAGLLDEMRTRGVTTLFYHQVDNPLAQVCDPEFIGWHLMEQSQVTTKVVAKTDAFEKVGLVAEIDGRTEIIEYSDLPTEIATQTTPAGQLKHWAGNTAIHLFERTFLEELATGGVQLPFHVAVKAVPALDETGQLCPPRVENAWKFERFVFDALPLAEKALVVETAREEEFCPLKNKSGMYSPEHVQRSLCERATRWLSQASLPVFSERVEIPAAVALTAGELREKVRAGLDPTGILWG